MKNVLTNEYKMSYFMPPIAPIKNEQGQTIAPATLIPFVMFQQIKYTR